MDRLLRAILVLGAASISSLAIVFGFAALSDPLPPDTTYRPLPARPFSAVKADDEAQKTRVMARQSELLNQRFDLDNKPMPGVMMSSGRKAVQAGVRVRLPARMRSSDAVCCLLGSCRYRTSS